MRAFFHAWAKEFWPRLLWACAIGHIILLVLFFTAPTVVQYQ